ncbi:MAG: lysophospholipid acyltransferase family protein [Acidobacteriota bacterium]
MNTSSAAPPPNDPHATDAPAPVDPAADACAHGPPTGHPWLRALGTVVTTVTGNVMLVLDTVVLGSIATVIGMVLPAGDRIIFHMMRLWSHLWLLSSGVRVTCRHAVPLDDDATYVFVVNHQSMFDIPVLLTTLPGQTRFLAKRGLFRLPIFGWALHAGGFIPVDRGRDAARNAVTHALDRLENGASVLIFAEQTRSRDGHLLPFKRGGFLIGIRSGKPIVPVAIMGTLNIRPRGSMRITPQRVEVRYGAPVATEGLGYDDRQRVADTLRNRVADLIRAPADGPLPIDDRPIVAEPDAAEPSA